MEEQRLRQFLEAAHRYSFLDYLDPQGESLKQALARRMLWAELHASDPEHGAEARFLLHHADALRLVLVGAPNDTEESGLFRETESVEPPALPTVEPSRPATPAHPRPRAVILATLAFAAVIAMAIASIAATGGTAWVASRYVDRRADEVPERANGSESRAHEVHSTLVVESGPELQVRGPEAAPDRIHPRSPSPSTPTPGVATEWSAKDRPPTTHVSVRPPVTRASVRPKRSSTLVFPTTTGAQVHPAPVESAESTLSVRPPPVETSEVPEDSCDDLRSLELTASMGKLGVAQAACLDARKVNTGERLTERVKVARILIADAQARCAVNEQSCSDYRRELKYFLTELDRSDVDVLYAWLLVLHRADRQTEEACEVLIWWADQTLELRQNWPPGDVFVERTSNTYSIRASAAYLRFEVANETYLDTRDPDDLEHMDVVRGEALCYVLEWLQYSRYAGLDSTVAWELCRSLTSDSGVCAS